MYDVRLVAESKRIKYLKVVVNYHKPNGKSLFQAPDGGALESELYFVSDVEVRA